MNKPLFTLSTVFKKTLLLIISINNILKNTTHNYKYNQKYEQNKNGRQGKK